MTSAASAPSLPTAALNPCATPRISVGNSSDAWATPRNKHQGNCAPGSRAAILSQRAKPGSADWLIPQLIGSFRSKSLLDATYFHCTADSSWVPLAKEVSG